MPATAILKLKEVNQLTGGATLIQLLKDPSNADGHVATGKLGLNVTDSEFLRKNPSSFVGAIHRQINNLDSGSAASGKTNAENVTEIVLPATYNGQDREALEKTLKQSFPNAVCRSIAAVSLWQVTMPKFGTPAADDCFKIG
jgi:hypothetical protein